MYQQALEICRQVLGKEHPVTNTVQKNYDLLMQKLKEKDDGG